MTTRPRANQARHGTVSGYFAHQRRDERACDACYRAKSAYDARYRDTPDHVRTARLRARAQRAALTRLKNVYPVLYRLLYEEEKRRLEREEAADVARSAEN